MIKNVKELDRKYPEIDKLSKELSNKALRRQFKLEIIDLMNMEERVSVFMQECTNNMCKTTYTIASIKELISLRKEEDLDEFCSDLNEMSTEGIMSEIKERADRFNKKYEI